MVLLCVMALGGCAETHHDSDSSGADSLRAVRIADATGRTVVLESPATRVVSLAPNLTEILFAIGAGDIVIGRSAHCNYPPAALALPIVSDMSTPNYERLLRLRPDLALMSFAGNSGAAYNKLLDLGLTPFAIATESIDGTLAAIDTIGHLIGRRNQARELVVAIRASIDSVHALARARSTVSAFIVLDRAPLMTVSGGFINEALEIAGGRNIAAGNPVTYPRYSREDVLRSDPDVIIVPSDSAVPASSLLSTFPEWSRLRAIRNGRVRALPPDVLFRPGPRLAESIDLIFKALH